MPEHSGPRTPQFLAGGIATVLLLALVVYLLFFRYDVPWY
jgi:hypothetical protein